MLNGLNYDDVLLVARERTIPLSATSSSNSVPNFLR